MERDYDSDDCERCKASGAWDGITRGIKAVLQSVC